MTPAPAQISELRPVPGYEGLYSVTRDGRVWSHPKSPKPGERGKKHAGQWMTLLINRRDNCTQIALARDGRRHTVRPQSLARLAWGDLCAIPTPAHTPSQADGGYLCAGMQLPGRASGCRRDTDMNEPIDKPACFNCCATGGGTYREYEGETVWHIGLDSSGQAHYACADCAPALFSVRPLFPPADAAKPQAVPCE